MKGQHLLPICTQTGFSLEKPIELAEAQDVYAWVSHKQGDSTMKKWMFVAVIAVMALIAGITLVPMALAQGPADGYGPGYDGGVMGSGGQFGPGFVDEDGDGVCDHAGEDGYGPGFVDEDGDGVCDHAGEGGYGPGFVDEDGDGVCDHAGSGGQNGHRGGRMARWAQQ